MFKKYKKWGFTIVEVMVVVAIIGILVGIVIAAGDSAKKAARDNQRRTDISLLQLKLEAYKADNGGLYPTTLQGLETKYIASDAVMPKDPLNVLPHTYIYIPLRFGSDNSTCGVSYYLSAVLENNNPNYKAISPVGTNLAACSGFSLPDRTAQTTYTYDLISPEAFQQ